MSGAVLFSFLFFFYHQLEEQTLPISSQDENGISLLTALSPPSTVILGHPDFTSFPAATLEFAFSSMPKFSPLQEPLELLLEELSVLFSWLSAPLKGLSDHLI